MARRGTWSAVLALAAIMAASGCDESSSGDPSARADAGADAAVDGAVANRLGACLDRPEGVEQNGAQLPCNLLPPGFDAKAQHAGH